jgi:hypothetical protein
MEAGLRAEGIDEEVGPEILTGGGGGNDGIITGNGAIALAPELVTTYAPVARLLTLGSLTPTAIASNELITTVLGRAFLGYLVKCALPSGESVTVSHLGTSYTFPGHVGIAPSWTSGALSTSNQRWLSACVQAHVNATTTNVSILLRGDHPALAVDAGPAAAAYTLREGAFYGNIFALTPKMYACTGDDTTSARLCAESVAGVSPCGFVVPGDCRGGLQNTCEGVNGNYYDTCHAGLILPLVPSTAYPETITVWLQP